MIQDVILESHQPSYEHLMTDKEGQTHSLRLMKQKNT